MPRPALPLSANNPARYLRAFLLEPHPVFGDAGQPLFSSPADLGARFASLTRGPLYEKASGKAFTAQVLQGKRSCPSKLCLAFRAAVRDRLEDADIVEGEREAVVTRLGEQVDMYNLLYEASKKAARSETSLLKGLNHSAQIGQKRRRPPAPTTQLALVVSPRYQMARRSPVGVKQIQQLAALLKLMEPASQPERRFMLCLDSFEAAKDVWQSLVEEGLRQDVLRGMFKPDEPNVRQPDRVYSAVMRRTGVHLRRLATLEANGFLTTYTVPLTMCLVPITIYDPGTANCRATVLRYASKAMDPQVNLPADLFQDVWQQLWRELENGTVIGISQVHLNAVRDSVSRDCSEYQNSIISKIVS